LFTKDADNKVDTNHLYKGYKPADKFAINSLNTIIKNLLNKL